MALLPFTLAFAVAAPAERTFASGPAQVALVELFTSEGCSSCPPAEKWLAQRRDDAGLWTAFVPIAFHVNVWDHLGWRDLLASKAFTDRQRAYAALWRASSIYTPCFVRNGAEWRPREKPNGSVDMATRQAGDTNVGQLRLTWRNDQTCRVEFAPGPQGSAAQMQVSVALLGGGIVSNVRKGENAGRKLRHEFVALRVESADLKREGGDSPIWTATLSLPSRTDIAAARRAIAGWVTPRGQLAPLQAVGGWLE